MTLSRLSVKHPVTTTMVFLAFFVLGIISLTRIGQELFPNVEFPTLVVITTSPGVGPSEIESTITIPIEGAVATVSGTETISSTSRDSVSQVVINFASGTNLDVAVNDIREALNEIENDFPSGTQRTRIFRFSASQLPSLRLNLYTQTQGINVRQLAEDVIIPRIERIPGVAQANIFGGQEEAVLVQLNLDSLNKLRIPITQVMQVFQGENVNLPGGTIRLADQNIILRTVGEFQTVEDIGNILLGFQERVPIFLSDLAAIDVGFKDQDEFVRTQGLEGIRLAIQKQSEFNTVQVNEAVLQELERLRPTLPPSLQIEIQEDQAEQVRASIGGVANSAWQGGLLAILVLLFFLRNLRSTMIVSAVIPLSIIATFSLIDFGGMTLNITSLMGITLAVGMFVDNAIVVLESIYRKQLMGLSPEDAAIEGSEEVAKAITASTLTTMAVFLPMLFVDGIAGALFQDLSLTISFSLAVSLIGALSFIPVLCAKFLRVQAVPEEIRRKIEEEDHELSLADVEVHTRFPWLNRISKGIQRILQSLDDWYEKAIRWSLHHVRWVLVSAVFLLVLSIGSILLLGMEFIPIADEAAFSIRMETRNGAPFEETAIKVGEIEQIIQQIADQDIVTMASRIGDGGSNFGDIEVRLTNKDDRTRSVWEITNQVIQQISGQVMDIQFNLTIEGTASLASTGAGDSTPIVVRLAGEDTEANYQYGQQLVALMQQIPGLQSPRVNFSFGKPELQFQIRRREAVGLGLTPLEIAGTIRTAYNGFSASTFEYDGRDLDVFLILRDEDRNNFARIRELTFTNPAGQQIPLENVVNIIEESGPIAIQRTNRERYIDVQSGTTGERPLNRIIDDLELAIAELGPPPPGTSLSIEGASAEMADSFQSLFLALLLAVALVYMVMASQFESFLNPFIVMFSVPFSIIGLTLALLLTNTTFNILSFTGAILLVGIVVNNAIVLIDYIALLRTRGETLEHAIIKGGRTRLKPILMTTITTLLGLIPMALGIGIGAELRAPMARAVIGGLATSTMITLILIPTIYWVIEERIKRTKDRTQASDQPSLSTPSETV